MIILSTGSLYSYGVARVFALAAETGYEGVEVLVDDRWDTRDPVYLRRLSEGCGLPIVALHNPFVVDVPGWPGDQLGRLEQTLALAQQLEVSLVVTHLPFRLCGIAGRLHGLGDRRFLIPLHRRRRGPYYHALRQGCLEEMETIAGVTIAVENMPARRILGRRVSVYWFNRPEELLRFPHLTLDTTHLGTWGQEPVDVYELVRERIVHVHLSDFDGREHRCPPDGRLRLDALLQRLAADGYRGAISVESAPGALAAEDEGRCRAKLERAAAFCRQHFVTETA